MEYVRENIISILGVISTAIIVIFQEKISLKDNTKMRKILIELQSLFDKNLVKFTQRENEKISSLKDLNFTIVELEIFIEIIVSMIREKWGEDLLEDSTFGSWNNKTNVSKEFIIDKIRVTKQRYENRQEMVKEEWRKELFRFKQKVKINRVYINEELIQEIENYFEKENIDIEKDLL